jgi:hypothetical protein
MLLNASMIATSSEPRHIEPNDVVIDLTNESRTPAEQNEVASVGTNHQVPTTPATVTWSTFLMT